MRAAALLDLADDLPTGPAAAPRRKREIPVRAMGFAFDAAIPRFWFAGSAHATHVANGINLLFPDGERFFIRSVKHYLDRIEDPGLRERVRGFFGQEGRHGHEHERYNAVLERQGYDLEPFLAWYRRVAYEVIEQHASPALRLSITAALEHFTATMARNALTRDVLDRAHPVMQELLRWHAAEEIEHKSVAFDVYQQVDGRYSMRALGLVLGFAGLMVFWSIATRELLAQEAARGTDLEASLASVRLSPFFNADRDRRRQMFREAFVEYLRPDFHPDQIDDTGLAKAYLASVGRLDG